MRSRGSWRCAGLVQTPQPECAQSYISSNIMRSCCSAHCSTPHVWRLHTRRPHTVMQPPNAYIYMLLLRAALCVAQEEKAERQAEVAKLRESAEANAARLVAKERDDAGDLRRTYKEQTGELEEARRQLEQTRTELRSTRDALNEMTQARDGKQSEVERTKQQRESGVAAIQTQLGLALTALGHSQSAQPRQGGYYFAAAPLSPSSAHRMLLRSISSREASPTRALSPPPSGSCTIGCASSSCDSSPAVRTRSSFGGFGSPGYSPSRASASPLSPAAAARDDVVERLSRAAHSPPRSTEPAPHSTPRSRVRSARRIKPRATSATRSQSDRHAARSNT